MLRCYLSLLQPAGSGIGHRHLGYRHLEHLGHWHLEHLGHRHLEHLSVPPRMTNIFAHYLQFFFAILGTDGGGREEAYSKKNAQCSTKIAITSKCRHSRAIWEKLFFIFFFTFYVLK